MFPIRRTKPNGFIAILHKIGYPMLAIKNGNVPRPTFGMVLNHHDIPFLRIIIRLGPRG